MDLVASALRDALVARGAGVTGLSCLADGADQVFARVVLETGGTLEAIVPAENHRDVLPPEVHPEYARLLDRASVVHHMPAAIASERTYMVASEFMVGLADELWAVWDGRPARGYGGTADVVTYARGRGIPIRVFWPEGATR
jgi:hypothetical protein